MEKEERPSRMKQAASRRLPSDSDEELEEGPWESLNAEEQEQDEDEEMKVDQEEDEDEEDEDEDQEDEVC